MRILITVHQFLPDFAAGTELLSLNVARELMSRGHEVRFVTGHPGPPEIRPDESRFDRYEYQGITIDRFTHAYVPMGGQSNVALLEHDNPIVGRHFAKLLSEFKPDLVHAYHLARLSTSPLAVCAEMGIPVVFTAMDFWTICPLSQLLLPDHRPCGGPSPNGGNCIKHLAVFQKPSLPRRAMQYVPDGIVGAAAALARNHLFPPTPFNPLAAAMSVRPELIRRRFASVRKIIVPSLAMRRILAANGLDESRMVLVRNAIDPSRIPRASGKGEQRELRIGFIGTLAPHKAPHVLLEAIRKLPRDWPIRLTLHGPGDPASPYPRQLQALAAGDGRIQMPGGFPNGQIGRILAEIDVLVVPSVWYENTPTVIYEAQAAGCAVVATDLAGMSEMIRPEQDGLLFPPGDSETLAEHLRRLGRDRPLVKRLCANAPPPPTVQNQATALESIYREVLLPVTISAGPA